MQLVLHEREIVTLFKCYGKEKLEELKKKRVIDIKEKNINALLILSRKVINIPASNIINASRRQYLGRAINTNTQHVLRQIWKYSIEDGFEHKSCTV